MVAVDLKTEGQVPDKLLLMWSNHQLESRGLEITDLDEDMKDGVRLINLLENVTGKTCGKYVKQPRMDIQRYNNTQIAFDFMAHAGVKPVNIGNEDITNGNPKLVRGLIWILMEHYLFGKPYAEAKNELLAWIQSKIPEYHITRFGQQWNDGKALCALVNAISPGTCPHHAELDTNQHLANVNKGMDMAMEYYSIPRIVNAEDICDPHVPEPLLVTYLSYFRDAVPVTSAVPVRANEPKLPTPVLSIPGIKDGIVSKEINFKITAPGVESGKLDVKIEGPDHECKAVVSESASGSYDVTFTPKVAGSYHGHVTIDGEKVPGSDFTFTVHEESNAGRTTAEGPGLVEGMATVPADFTVTAPKAGKVDVKVVGPALCGAEPEIKENGAPGTYTCRYFPEVPGDYLVHVAFNGEPIPQSPWKVPILPEDPNEAAKRDPRVCQCLSCEPNMFDKRYCRVCLKWVAGHYLLLKKTGMLNTKDDKDHGSFRVTGTLRPQA